MICPCKGCERSGCGEYHTHCQKYKDWKKENDDKKKWLHEQRQEPTEGAIKGQRKRIKDGTSRRKWNVKTSNGGDGRW